MRRPRLYQPCTLLFTGAFLLSFMVGVRGVSALVCCDLPPEEKKHRDRLGEQIGFERSRGRITKPYSERMLADMLTALKHDNPRLRAVMIDRELLAIVRQVAVPPEVLEHMVVPHLEAVRAEPRTKEDQQEGFTERAVARVLWHIEVKRLTDVEQRRAFLKAALEKNRTVFDAIEYVVEIGDEVATELLQNRLGRMDMRDTGGFGQKLISHLRAGIDQIAIQQHAKAATPEEQVQFIRNYFEQYNKKPDKRNDRDIVTWLIWRLEDMPHPEASRVLRELWQDESVDALYRDQIQDILLRLQAIAPHEKLILIRY